MEKGARTWMQNIRGAEIAQAVAQWFLVASLTVTLAIIAAALWDWKSNGFDQCGITLDQTTISYRESAVGDGVADCDISDICGNIESWNTSIALLSNTGTSIGVGHGHCLGLADVTGGALWQCTRIFTFDGSGGVSAGNVVIQGNYFVPTNVSNPAAWQTSVFSVTGGSGSFFGKPIGGEATFTTTVTSGLIAYMDGTLVINRVH